MTTTPVPAARWVTLFITWSSVWALPSWKYGPLANTETRDGVLMPRAPFAVTMFPAAGRTSLKLAALNVPTWNRKAVSWFAVIWPAAGGGAKSTRPRVQAAPPWQL